MRPWTKKRKLAQSKRFKANPPNPGTKGVWPSPQNYKPQYGNNNATRHGLESKPVQKFRRLERVYLADPNNVVKLEAAEESRLGAVHFLESLIRAGIKNPSARVEAVYFIVRQTSLCAHRTERKSSLKGNRWTL